MFNSHNEFASDNIDPSEKEFDRKIFKVCQLHMYHASKQFSHFIPVTYNWTNLSFLACILNHYDSNDSIISVVKQMLYCISITLNKPLLKVISL